ncbi:MAG: hypothetical protein P0Y49_11155 [Candidatus Pedobacter colombiensis]|uniref:Uncharacterized protein n=1 Tax=Candidatus Pedobacter colombiensis TaxID=3121371 RepID=A0AAJ6B810_9SPHI|nr:hypothetical protein [Pedobacter sp.]WEK21692.1 MAG: hypothetical protein P0Y49_11155 [Pedobacter sp.]
MAYFRLCSPSIPIVYHGIYDISMYIMVNETEIAERALAQLADYTGLMGT